MRGRASPNGRSRTRSPEKGARTAVHLATAAEVAGTSGKLFADGKPVGIGGQARQPGLGERLWKESAAATRLAG